MRVDLLHRLRGSDYGWRGIEEQKFDASITRVELG